MQTRIRFALTLGLALWGLAGCQSAAPAGTPTASVATGTPIPTLVLSQPSPMPPRCIAPQIGDRLAWSVNGSHLAYGFQQSTVRRVYVVNLASRQPGGTVPPRLIAADGWEFDWHPDGNSLIYAAASGRNMTILDVIGQTLAEIDVGWQHMMPVWSPDGLSVAFVHAARQRDATGLAESGLLTVTPSDTSTGRVLVSLADLAGAAAGVPEWPTWEPGGQALAFAAGDKLALAAADTGELTVLSGSDDCATQPAWVPGSDQLLSALIRPAGTSGWSLMLINPTDGTQSALQLAGVAEVLRYAWSPGGTEIAFIGTSEGNGDKPDVFVVNRDGSNLTAVTATPAVGETALAWSPDGTTLATVANGQIVLTDLIAGTQSLLSLIPTR